MYKTPRSKITAFFNPIKKKVIDVTSDVMSAPARLKAARVSRQADRDVATLKRARAYDKAPSFDASGKPTDALKARTAADEVRMRLRSK